MMMYTKSIVLVFCIVFNAAADRVLLPGGTPVDESNFVVLININDIKTTHYCTGTLIRIHSVLTSASCMFDGKTVRYFVCGGTTKEQTCTKLINLYITIQKRKVHNLPGIIDEGVITLVFTKKEPRRCKNIAIILLENGFYPQEGVRPIPLILDHRYIIDKERCYKYGFGIQVVGSIGRDMFGEVLIPEGTATTINIQPADVLLQLKIDLIDAKKACVDFQACKTCGDFSLMYAALKKGQGVCVYDEGAPLVCDGRLVGVLSKYRSCGIPDNSSLITFLPLSGVEQFFRLYISSFGTLQMQSIVIKMIILTSYLLYG